MTPNNLYNILGVPKNATPELIKMAYRKLIKNIGLDRLIGLLNKTTDEDIKKVIQAQIDQKTEEMKQINEAYDVLSDPTKRANYDRTRGSASAAPPSRPKPEIVLSTTSLNFGTMTKGEDKTKSFTVDNRGGMPEEIRVDWETVPYWAGELVIEPNSTRTFPIKVTVETKTESVATGSYAERILVIVDGVEYSLSVLLKVSIPATAPTPTNPRPKATIATPPPTARPAPAPVYTPTGLQANTLWGIIGVVGAILLFLFAVNNKTVYLPVNVPDKFKVYVLNYKISGLNGYTGPDTVNVLVTNNDTRSHEVWVWAVAWYNTLPSDNTFPPNLTSAIIQTNCGNPCEGVTVGANSSATISLIGKVYSDYNIENLVQLCVEIAGIDEQVNLINSDNSPQWRLYPASPGCNPYFPDER